MQLTWPLPAECNRITQRFGANPDFYASYGLAGHEGLDIACPVGTPTLATHNGWTKPGWRGEYGDSIKVYGDGLMTFHAHLNRTTVTFGQSVNVGDKIGFTGKTGRTTGPHLHYGLKISGVANADYKGWLDPEPYLRRESVTKTSAHIQRIEPWMQQALIDLGSNWVKFVNPPAGPDPMPRISNKIVRIWTDDIDAQFIARGEAGGRDFVRHMLPQWRERSWGAPEYIAEYDGKKVVYSLANEPESNSNTGLANLCAYSLGAMREADANGIKVVILELPEGNPGDNQTGDVGVSAWKLQQLAPAVREAVALGHYVGLHAYWRPGVEGPLGRWHALGRIEWDVEIWQQLGIDISNLKLLVTEWGVDGGIAPEQPGHAPKTGWLTLCDPTTYFQEVAEGERRARQLPWLKSLLLFDWGPESEWVSFGHDEGAVRSIIRATGPLLEPPLVGDEFTQAEIVRCRTSLGLVPATIKASIERDYIWVKELYQSGDPYAFAVAYDPQARCYVALKLETRAWRIVAEIEL